jgi:tRNA pseudouridine38-40 synthase
LHVRFPATNAVLKVDRDTESTSPKPPRANWKVVLAYDGTNFHGWQVQPGALTIQGELAQAIHRVTGETVLPQGSGRTDAGVHARGQVASFSLAAAIPAVNLMRALNRTLPSSICVLSAEIVDQGFHARHSASAKTYEYRVVVADPFTGSFCLPWDARFVYAIERPLHLDRMQQAAAAVVGTHDFTSFAAVDPDRAQRLLLPFSESETPSNIRTILHSTWSHSEEPDELDLLIYRVTGGGFLHHMVRNLVGTFLEIGWGERSPAEIETILAARDRAAAGRMAPARGLFLHSVEYPSPTLPIRIDEVL